MAGPPQIFDRECLAMRRKRAVQTGGADFLHVAVAHEVSERLLEVNRQFQNPAIIGPRNKIWVEILKSAGISVDTSVADSDILPLEEVSHDLVIHALALHWAHDPVGQLVQARHALKPDGLFLAALFGGETIHELRASMAEAEIALTGGISPRVSPMGEIRDLGGLLQRAGMALPVADSQRFDVTYETPVHLMHDLRAMGETNVMQHRLRTPMRRDLLDLACKIYTDQFADPDGRVRATFEVVFLTGWSPSPDQQQPLRPGSASTRLADALGVPEFNAGEKTGGGHP